MMARRSMFSFFQSIKFRLLILLLGMTALAIVGITLIAINVAQNLGRSAEQVSSKALLSQAETYLVQLTQSSADENDLILDQVRKSAQQAADYTAYIYDHHHAFEGNVFWRMEDHMTFGADGQYANSKDDLSSAFLPNTTKIDSFVQQDIEISAYLEPIFASIQKNVPNVEAIYFGTSRDVVRYYPNVDLGNVLPPDFQVTQRVWYSGSTLENDPQRWPWWTSPYVDATGLGLVTTAAMPVYNQGQELIGVIGIDITLNNMKANIESTRFLKSGYSFLIDHSGHAVALPDQGFTDILGHPAGANEINADLSGTTTGFAPIVAKMIAGESGFVHLQVDGLDKFVAYAPLKNTGWSLGSVAEASDVLQSIPALQSTLQTNTRMLILTRVLPISVGVFILVILMALALINRVAEPIQKLVVEVQKVGAGQWDIEVPQTRNDEIGALARAFKSMAEQQRKLFLELEQRVSDRTRDLERRTLQVRVAAEIARDVSAAQDLDKLLDEAVNLIRGRFGFYHAGIFLTDEQGEYAVLRAATGEAGKAMLAKEHKLRVGQEGIVGYVTKRGQPRIALDVGADATHFKNPLLPETRSEMALPLKVGEQIIGALDVQSQHEAAFGEDDITALQIMADQLAVAIQNARLLREVQENLHEMEVLYSRYGHEAWQDVARSKSVLGYRFDRSGVAPILTESRGNGHHQEADIPFSLPLVVRGEVIANLDVWPEGGELSAEEVALLENIASRLSQAMESARLYEETVQRAEREQLVSEITGHMRETLDIDTVLKTAAREIRQALALAEVEVRLGNPHE